MSKAGAWLGDFDDCIADTPPGVKEYPHQAVLWRAILVGILLIFAGLVFYAFIYRNLKRDGQR